MADPAPVAENPPPDGSWTDDDDDSSDVEDDKLFDKEEGVLGSPAPAVGSPDAFESVLQEQPVTEEEEQKFLKDVKSLQMTAPAAHSRTERLLRDSGRLEDLVELVTRKFNDSVYLLQSYLPPDPAAVPSPKKTGKVDKKPAAAAATSGAVMKGWMFKRRKDDKKWRRRFFILTQTSLLCFTDETFSTEKGVWDMTTVKTDAAKSRPKCDRPCLSIAMGKKEHYLAADTKRENVSWHLALTCIQEQLSYSTRMAAQDTLPDPRILKFFRNTTTQVALKLDGDPLPAAACEAMTSSLRFHTVLHILSLQRAGIDDTRLSLLCDGIDRNRSIATLRLGGNKIADGGASRLAAMLMRNTTLTELRLEGNGVGDDGVGAIAAALAEHADLRVLALDGNRVGDDGAAALAHALRRPHKMAAVQLRENLVDVKGACALADMLGENPHVKCLDLRGNRLDSGGMNAFLMAVVEAKNETLLDLRLSNNPCQETKVRSCVVNLLMKHPMLKHFDLKPIDMHESISLLRVMRDAGCVGDAAGQTGPKPKPASEAPTVSPGPDTREDSADKAAETEASAPPTKEEAASAGGTPAAKGAALDFEQSFNSPSTLSPMMLMVNQYDDDLSDAGMSDAKYTVVDEDSEEDERFDTLDDEPPASAPVAAAAPAPAPAHPAETTDTAPTSAPAADAAPPSYQVMMGMQEEGKEGKDELSLPGERSGVDSSSSGGFLYDEERSDD